VAEPWPKRLLQFLRGTEGDLLAGPGHCFADGMEDAAAIETRFRLRPTESFPDAPASLAMVIFRIAGDQAAVFIGTLDKLVYPTASPMTSLTSGGTTFRTNQRWRCLARQGSRVLTLPRTYAMVGRWSICRAKQRFGRSVIGKNRVGGGDEIRTHGTG
jgi:hypothetical protein